METIELYKKTHLPENGWIQGCFHCKSKTSFLKHIMDKMYKKKMYKFDCYLCKDCKILFNHNKPEYYQFLKNCALYIYCNY